MVFSLPGEIKRRQHPTAQCEAGLRLAQNYVFNSPSTAAGVFLGRAANGRVKWKDEQARTLEELQALAVR